MQLQRFAWFFWLGGTTLIILSWTGAVIPTVGWTGFAISLVGAVISWMPQQEDRSQYPLTQEGLPVEPSGAPVPPDNPLEPGTPLLAFSQGKWWRAAVISVAQDDKVLVCFPGWDPQWQELIPRRHLQIDPDPNRMPMKLPPQDALDRLGDCQHPEGMRAAGPSHGVQQAAEESKRMPE